MRGFCDFGCRVGWLHHLCGVILLSHGDVHLYEWALVLRVDSEASVVDYWREGKDWVIQTPAPSLLPTRHHLVIRQIGRFQAQNELFIHNASHGGARFPSYGYNTLPPHFKEVALLPLTSSYALSYFKRVFILFYVHFTRCFYSTSPLSPV